MNCPVCPARDLPEDCTCCPVCHADLLPLQRVRQLYLAQYAEAQRLFELGLIDTALHHAAAALALNPSYAPGLKLLGRLFWRKGAAQEALSRWEEAARLDPGDTEVQALLQDARRELRVRETRRMRRWCLACGGGALAVTAVILYAALYVNPRLESLAARTGYLEGAASRVPALGPQPGADPSAESKAIQTLRARLETLERGWDALARGQQQMVDQLKTTGDAAVDDQRRIRAATADLAELRRLTTDVAVGGLGDLSNAVGRVFGRFEGLQAALEGVQATQTTAAVQAQTMMRASAESQEVWRGTRQEILVLQHWLTNTAQAAVVLLQPAAYESLAAQIATAREELARHQREQARPRESSGLSDVAAGLGARQRVLAAQKRLAVLEADWQKHVEPWLRFKMFLSTNLQPLAIRVSPPAAGSGSP